jgi:phosphoribosylglycinamide formyltransferase-1
MIKLGMFISGGGTTATSIVNAIISGTLTGIETVCVIASKPSAGGIEKLKTAGIPTENIYIVNPKDYADRKEFGERLIEICDKHRVQLIGQYGWLVKTPVNVIEKYPDKIINQHPGPLDIGREDFGGKGMYGMRVHAARLYFVQKTGRDATTEATTHYVTEEFDDGAVIGRSVVEILPEDTPESLQARVLPAEHSLQITVLQDFADSRVEAWQRSKPLVQDSEEKLLASCKAEAIKNYPNG